LMFNRPDQPEQIQTMVPASPERSGNCAKF